MSWITLECNHRVKTRKAHVCEGCGRLWPAGTLMETWTGMWEGDKPERVYLCLVCNQFWWDKYLPSSEVTFDRSIPDWDPESYVKTEAKLALYVIEAGVTPVASHLIAWR